MTDVHVPRVEPDAGAAPGPSPEVHIAGARAATDAGAAAGAAGAGAVAFRSKSLLKIGLEVILISAGVFLGLMGEQWRENAEHRQLAQASLRRFRAEILENRKAVRDVVDYHVTTKAKLEKYFAAPPKDREAVGVRVRGLQPVFFARTAWDLALATQSLAHIDPELAVPLSRIYRLQQDYADLTRGVMQAMYVRIPSENVDEFLATVNVYYGDVVYWEPALLKQYDELLPRLERALGDAAGESTAQRQSR